MAKQRIPKRFFYGWWVVVSASLTLLITVGVPFYGIPFFYDYFIREFGWSRAATTGGIALATVLIQPVAGSLLHRFSPRKGIVFGAAMLACALVVFGFGNGNLLIYYAGWCAFMVGYIYAGPLPHQVLLTRWFRRNRGLAIGVSYLGLGLGGAISQKLVALPLIHSLGWRLALAAMGASMLLVIPLALFVLRDKPADMGLFPDGNVASHIQAAASGTRLGEFMRTGPFWLLSVGSFASIGAIGSINQHMKLLFQDAGLSGQRVADTTFIILISSLVGRVATGWFVDRFDKKAIMVAAYLFVALPVPLLFVVARPGMPDLFGYLFGFGVGADYMLIPLMAAELFGPDSLARVMGFILPLDSIGQTCCPFIAGMLRDRLGNYTAALALVTALGLLGVASIALLPGAGRRVQRAADAP